MLKFTSKKYSDNPYHFEHFAPCSHHSYAPTPHTQTKFNHYRSFSHKDWAKMASGLTLPITESELLQMRSINDPISISEVANIYLPIAQFLHMMINCIKANSYEIDYANYQKGPFIIGLAGSVAAGKSTTARLMCKILASLSKLKVSLVTTDGFLYPNSYLQSQGLMRCKGFPQSYDIHSLLCFLRAVREGRPVTRAPVYSHVIYDIVPGQFTTINKPDVLILEGLNVLQGHEILELKELNKLPYSFVVSDFFDFSIYLDAPEQALQQWYVDRFMYLRDNAFRNPMSYFNNYTRMSPRAVENIAQELWQSINLVNLRSSILPTKYNADLIIAKDDQHKINQIHLKTHLL